MYRKFKFDEKIKFVECRILWKLIGKLCTFNRQKVQIHRRIQLLRMYNIMKIQWKTQYFRCTARPDSWGKKKKKNIDFVECTKSQKVKGKLSALDEQNFRIHGEFQIH